MNWGCEWHHAPEACVEDFEEIQLVESCGPKKKGDFHHLAMALWRVPHVLGGGRWKSQHRKIVPLSHVEKPLNSKVIKCFIPELRSRYVFFMFQDSYVLCIYVMDILCMFHIFLYGYVTIQTLLTNHYKFSVLFYVNMNICIT